MELIAQHKATHSLTLNINRGMNIDNVKRLFGKICYRVDQDRFSKKRVDRIVSSFRFSAIAFIEHADSHPHLHAAVNLSPSWLGGFVDDSYVCRLEAHWLQITKDSGSIQLDPIFCDAGWGRYITKSMRRDDEFLLSTDFHPSNSLIQSSDPKVVFEQLAP